MSEIGPTAETSDADKAALHDLHLLNQISQALNRHLDVRGALDEGLALLVDLLGLQSGWVFVRNPAAAQRWAGPGFILAAHHQLPPALAIDNQQAWDKGCSCQTLCLKGDLDQAYNEVHCSRLAEASGDKKGLVVHASVPLTSGEQVLGILNVAAASWAAFDERALEFLQTAGSQMGVAVERAWLHDLLRERRFEEQEALLTLSQKLLGQSSDAGLEGFVVEEVRRLLNAASCALLLPEEPGADALVFRAASGWHDDPVAAGRRLPLDAQSRIGRVFLSQRPLTARVNRQAPVSPLEKWAAVEAFQAIAAVPLVVESDSVGVLAAHAREAREFDADDLRFLQLMANQVAIVLEARRLQNEAMQLWHVERELAVARDIQRSMLPGREPQISGWQLAATYRAAREVGGDFYDFFPVTEDNQQWNVVIADVADKGVPAALQMVLSRTAVRNASSSNRSPSETLQTANRYMLEDTQSDILVSALCGRLFADDGRFLYSNAGHNYPLWWHANTQSLTEMTRHGMILGVRKQVQLDDYEIVMLQGDVLILYTDGVTEAFNSLHEEFGTERLQRVIQTTLLQNPAASAADLVGAIETALADFVEPAPVTDDVTLLVARYTGQSGAGQPEARRE